MEEKERKTNEETFESKIEKNEVTQENIPEEVSKSPEPNEQNKKTPKPKIKTIIIILVASLLLVVVILFILLNSQYNDANKAFDNKKYLEAISKYEKISWYNDAEERLNNSYTEYGIELMNNDDCQTAITYFDKAKLDENNENVKYCNMFIKYYDAFKKAEEDYKAGKLSSAKEKYSKIDSSFKYKGVSVDDRLNTLKEYKKFVDLSGTKRGTGKMEVRHIYKRDGSWESWYADYTSTSEVKCQILENGDVKIFIIANFYSYSKYSTLSYALGEKEYTAYYTATVKKNGSIPSKFGSFPAAVAPSGTKGKATLKYSNGKFTLNFLLDDKNYSQYFRNKYTSKITYK